MCGYMYMDQWVGHAKLLRASMLTFKNSACLYTHECLMYVPIPTVTCVHVTTWVGHAQFYTYTCEYTISL